MRAAAWSRVAHTTSGYLLDGRRTSPGGVVVQAPGLSLYWRLPTFGVWLSFGLRGPGVV